VTILSAKYANPHGSVVVAQTVEAGAELVYLDGPEISGGWREIYLAWREDHETEDYSDPSGE
jgi:hypothetical protein